MNIDQTLQRAFQLAVPEMALVGVACVLYLLGTARGVNRHLAGFIALGGLALGRHFAHFTALPAVEGDPHRDARCSGTSSPCTSA